MHLILWEFTVQPGQQAAFERLYGPQGQWCLLFNQAEGYLGSDLYRDEELPLRYLTADRWASPEHFEAFHRDHQAAYLALDELCQALFERENFLGAFRSVE